ncbi:restriction endonuclease, partial [Streptococcus pneumoniae]|nr:restriction endonuclease [Streptococcus pneumoniae]MDA5262676.1 restriction endonuclease [Streptococcus pneumoniae]MDA5275035.1 restriction endonuclease [Streptococcus pneumoniae]
MLIGKKYQVVKLTTCYFCDYGSYYG